MDERTINIAARWECRNLMYFSDACLLFQRLSSRRTDGSRSGHSESSKSEPQPSRGAKSEDNTSAAQSQPKDADGATVDIQQSAGPQPSVSDSGDEFGSDWTSSEFDSSSDSTSSESEVEAQVRPRYL